MRLLTYDSTTEEVEAVTQGQYNEVTVAWWECTRGLERKVIVGWGKNWPGRLNVMSRCTSQLIWIGEKTD